MPDGGVVTITTANLHLDHDMGRQIGVSPGEYVSLSVSDTGVGMTPETVNRVFEPFFTTKPLGMGTGLGLSMVHGFTHQSGGHTRIHSAFGQGTTVQIILPRSADPLPIEALPINESSAPATASTEKVLVIDDEPDLRFLITEVLSDLGYTVLQAEDGAEGLRILQSVAHIDLLVTDVGLPGTLNGRQVADAARVFLPLLPVLFITGFAENAVLNHGHLGPAMEILTKPFALSVLETRVRSLLAKE